MTTYSYGSDENIGTASVINLDQSFVDKYFTSGGFIASGTPALVELKDGVLSISELAKAEPVSCTTTGYTWACGHIPDYVMAHWDNTGHYICGGVPVKYAEEFTKAQAAAQKPRSSIICGCISPQYIDQYWGSNAKFYSGQLPRDESISSGADYLSTHVASGGDMLPRDMLSSGGIFWGSVCSGSIASGQIASFHLASGALCSGAVFAAPTRFDPTPTPQAIAKVEAVKEEPQPSVPSNWVIKAVKGAVQEIADWFPG